MITKNIYSPSYVVDEKLLRKNLELIRGVAQAADIEIIMAFKAFALWKIFPIIREYISSTTASSLAEARLAVEKFGRKAHTYSPVYTSKEFDHIAKCSSHITFNSLAQFAKFKKHTPANISCGLRINPEISVVATDMYNPAQSGSRLGVTISGIPSKLPDGIEGLHFHVLCESTSFDLEKVLIEVEEKFEAQLKQVKWINMGGGHLISREGYNTKHLIAVLQAFRQRHPHLQIILEPGSAFVWQTGYLLSSVEDIVENNGIHTAMLNVSFACHMPDCLEMPYRPTIRGAVKKTEGKYCYRMGGNSCLSGDFVGNWYFKNRLNVGDEIIFEDMIHYTTVKTTMFNGVSHPSIYFKTADGKMQLLRSYQPEDYFDRMC